MLKKLKLGTRNSKLALIQAELVKKNLIIKYPQLEIQLVTIVSSGDKSKKPLALIGGKGLFVKELDEALIKEKIDFAVHSAKDIPAIVNKEIEVLSILDKANINDSVINKDNKTIDQLVDGSIIGTCSIRRKLQLNILNPTFIVKPLRGNIDTRINKLKTDKFDAIILAQAAIDRLNYKIGQPINNLQMLPAFNQGVLACSFLKKRSDIKKMLKLIQNQENEIRFQCERKFLEKLNADCTTPIAGWSQLNKEKIYLKVAIFSNQYPNKIYLEDSIKKESAYRLGINLAQKLLNKGAKKIIEDFKSMN